MCEHCCKVASKLSRCSLCHHAWYCSVTCQRAAWRDHKASCAYMERAGSAPLFDTEQGLRPFSALHYFRDTLRVRFSHPCPIHSSSGLHVLHPGRVPDAFQRKRCWPHSPISLSSRL